jgi:FixJ family two-component response regulator
MSRTGPTIVIIDDDASVRKALRRLLCSTGLTVETFGTAEAFLHSAGRPAPDCLILDLHLPGLSGLELQARLAAEGRPIPVVFITAYPEGPARDAALRAGAVAFLVKPFEEGSLLDAVARALCPGRRGAEDERAANG